MIPKAIIKTIQLPDGREITIETGRLAKQADGSAVVRLGDTMLLATVVSSKEAKEGVDFLPLSVDYQEKFAAAGKIPGGFLKREGRLSDHEVLISRLVDRALRPLFPDDYHADTQVMIQLISSDDDISPDALAALAASSALAVSDIPFGGPISEVRVSRRNGEWKINAPISEIEESDISLIVAATKDNIMMVEGEMKEVQEDEMLEALKVAHEAIKTQCEVQLELEKEVGTSEKRVYSHEEHDEGLKDKMHQELYPKVYAIAKQQHANKDVRSDMFKSIKDEFIDSLGEESEYDEVLIGMYFKDIQKEACRNLMLDEGLRLDGRKFDEIRPIWSEVDYLPSAHGSAVFTRGETQSLTTCTLGTKLDEQMIDGAVYSGTNKFLLHYNFPGFSTGEVRPNRGPGRREVGHGNLALRALKQVVPADEDNPYTIRIVSDILESNGSSSMATVCAGAMAMMDAGVPISNPVSGIAMGMVSDPETGKYRILSDILGDEDHLGDMDFKVTGTKNGITACQMDIKIDGLSHEILKEALEQSKKGRLHILEEMNKTISAPREDYKEHAPRYETIKIGLDQIGAVIGPGGKIIQEIQKESGATIIVEEKDNHGLVNIFANDKDKMKMAADRVKAIVALPEVGETYTGTVKSIMPFGAFIEFMPGKEGLLHISEIKWERVENMEGVLEIGEEVQVKLLDIDKKTGKFKLSRKALLPRPPRKERQNKE
ncbi:polyribonucleotide nucleotidyltransferase [Mangrovivirga sp. M17]|uniref:Polyribonucleotide nucleotidyltransferase n=1 Tax=Mangrovivirga halotolerans TaxID=2993936 RepID=A0ABT3RS71_9BACT|nr:polyribonucleotide nucleotidyltransferase [Mangrovivirga halotolerans]MCX2744336.1 polyribonucleotide nucleotidyltransferase [Mangrovivirga halotolerans]